MQMPILRSLFGQTNDEVSQSDIVMLLTPHIVRTHELTAADLAPIFIGTQSNIGLAGPPPLIAPGDPRRSGPPPTGAGVAAWRARAGGAAAAGDGRARRATSESPRASRARPPCRRRSVRYRRDCRRRRRCRRPHRRPNRSLRHVIQRRRRRQHRRRLARRADAGADHHHADRHASSGLRGGPYIAPLSINNASRVSTLSLTITYDPAVLRVQDGAGRARSCVREARRRRSRRRSTPSPGASTSPWRASATRSAPRAPA